MQQLNPSIRVRAIVLNERGEVAFVRQLIGADARYVLPGGGVESNETIRGALRRELVEETHLLLDEVYLVGLRETLIAGYYRSVELFFTCNNFRGELLAGQDPDKSEQVIVGARWLGPSCSEQVLPEFTWDIVNGSSFFTISEELTIDEYIRKYKVLPGLVHGRELVYVMLKPDALEHGLEDAVTNDLELLGGVLCAQLTCRLSQEQIHVIYHDFNHPKSQEMVFNYLTENATTHLVFHCPPNSHELFNAAKGETGTNEGLRGKYVTWYTPLDEAARDGWLRGEHGMQDKISLEMFCRNLLHVAPEPETSVRSIEAVFGK